MQRVIFYCTINSCIIYFKNILNLQAEYFEQTYFVASQWNCPQIGSVFVSGPVVPPLVRLQVWNSRVLSVCAESTVITTLGVVSVFFFVFDDRGPEGERNWLYWLLIWVQRCHIANIPGGFYACIICHSSKVNHVVQNHRDDLKQQNFHRITSAHTDINLTSGCHVLSSCVTTTVLLACPPNSLYKWEKTLRYPVGNTVCSSKIICSLRKSNGENCICLVGIR